MQEAIGFDKQAKLSGACGKYSMQHALLVLGIPITQKDASKATGVPPIAAMRFGTDRSELKRGLRYFGCDAVEYVFLDDSDKLRKKLDWLLESGCPVILSVEGDDHWIVIAGKESENKYYWIDSADDDVIGYWSWKDIVDWIDNDEYYLMGVEPKNQSQLRHSLVRDWSKVYALLDDEDLCDYWGYYLEDLVEIFDSPIGAADALTAKEFFDQFSKMIHDASCYYYLYSDADKMKWELGNYRKVATLHNLTVSRDKIPQAIASLSAALTCIACVED